MSQALVDMIAPIVIFIYLIFSVIFRLDFRISVGAGLLLLISGSVLYSIGGNESLAEQVGVYAFYFLVVGLLLSLIEHLRALKKTNNQ